MGERTNRRGALSIGLRELDDEEVYTAGFLDRYDTMVLGFAFRYIWRCPREAIEALYVERVGSSHVDIGPGTGGLLAELPDDVLARVDELHLVDVNAEPLRYAGERLAALRPQVWTRDVFQEGLPEITDVDSVSLTNVVHCVPGEAGALLDVLGRDVASRLNPGGWFFGCTIVGKDGPHGLPARLVSRAARRRGVFSNADDAFSAIEASLDAHFSQVQVWVQGSVAFFEAQR